MRPSPRAPKGMESGPRPNRREARRRQRRIQRRTSAKKPYDVELDVAYDLYLYASSGDEHQARADLVKDLADSCGVTKEAARGWLRGAGIG